MVNRKLRITLAGVLTGTLILIPATAAQADTIRDGQWPLKFWKIAEAHAITQGEGITVAVVDTGVDANQPDLVGNVLPGFDVWSAARDGRTDPDGHGTTVASLIAGHGHGLGGREGILGIAPKAKILPLSFSQSNKADNFSHREMANGIRRAVDGGAHVICFAAHTGSTEELKSAVEYALSKNVPIIAPAGNVSSSTITGFPASYEGVMAISAINEQGLFDAAVSLSDSAVSFAAPGVNIPVPKLNGGYSTTQGTSLSTALVAGVIALTKAKYPQLGATGIYERLKATLSPTPSKKSSPPYLLIGTGITVGILLIAIITLTIIGPRRRRQPHPYPTPPPNNYQ